MGTKMEKQPKSWSLELNVNYAPNDGWRTLKDFATSVAAAQWRTENFRSWAEKVFGPQAERLKTRIININVVYPNGRPQDIDRYKIH